VGVVAGYAIDSAIRLLETDRFDQTYRLVPDETGIVGPDRTRAYHRGQTVTASTEFKLLVGRGAAMAKRQSERLRVVPATGCLNMGTRWSMATLARDVGYHRRWIEDFRTSVRSYGRVATKAILRLRRGMHASQLGIAGGMSGERQTRGQSRGLSMGEKTQAVLAADRA
jgi:hypothetical protein